MCFSLLLNFCIFFAMGQLALEWSVSEPLQKKITGDQRQVKIRYPTLVAGATLKP